MGVPRPSPSRARLGPRCSGLLGPLLRLVAARLALGQGQPRPSRCLFVSVADLARWAVPVFDRSPTLTRMTASTRSGSCAAVFSAPTPACNRASPAFDRLSVSISYFDFCFDFSADCAHGQVRPHSYRRLHMTLIFFLGPALPCSAHRRRLTTSQVRHRPIGRLDL